MLDVMNEREDIQAAFQPFYQETLLEGDLSYDLIYQTKRDLRQFDVYHDDDVDKVAAEYSATASSRRRHAPQPSRTCSNR